MAGEPGSQGRADARTAGLGGEHDADPGPARRRWGGAGAWTDGLRPVGTGMEGPGCGGHRPPVTPHASPRPQPQYALMEPHASSIFYLILCVHVFLLLPYKLLEAGTMSDLSCYPPHGLAEVLSQRIYLLNKCLQN